MLWGVPSAFSACVKAAPGYSQLAGSGLRCVTTGICLPAEAERSSALRREAATEALPLRGASAPAPLPPSTASRQLAGDEARGIVGALVGAAGLMPEALPDSPRRLSSSSFQLAGRAVRCTVTGRCAGLEEGAGAAALLPESGAALPRSESSSCLQLGGSCVRCTNGLAWRAAMFEDKAGAEVGFAAGAPSAASRQLADAERARAEDGAEEERPGNAALAEFALPRPALPLRIDSISWRQELGEAVRCAERGRTGD